MFSKSFLQHSVSFIPLQASADVKTDSPVTPLLVAAHQGLCDYIKFLLNNDADTYMPDEVSFTIFTCLVVTLVLLLGVMSIILAKQFVQKMLISCHIFGGILLHNLLGTPANLG
jgi:ankyrin repeat protein